MYPKVFGWQHLTFLAVFIVLSVVSLVLIKLYVKSEKSKDIAVSCAGVILFSFILWNRISIAVAENNGWMLIPETFCGLSSLILSLATMFGKRNNNILHFVFYFSVVGGFLTMIYPTFLNQNPSFLYSGTISGMLHHAMSLYICVLLCMTGWFAPNYKKWPNLVIGFLSYITLGTFLMTVLGFNDAFYIKTPVLPETPLTVWLLLPIFLVSYIIFMVVYELIKRKLKTSANIKSSEIDKVEEENSKIM